MLPILAFAQAAFPADEFQWAPTLGGECYEYIYYPANETEWYVSKGTHPWG